MPPTLTGLLLAIAALASHAVGTGCGVALRADAYTRCACNPLAQAGHRHNASGLVEVSIGDPDVTLDIVSNTWRAFWSTGLAPSFLEPNTLVLKAAQSTDGYSWDVVDDPVLMSGGLYWDYSAVETPSVVRMPAGAPPERAFLLLYSGGDHRVPHAGSFTFTWYQLGAAFSPDPALNNGAYNFTRVASPYAPGTAGFQDTRGLVLLGRDAFPGLPGCVDGIAADPELVVAPDGTLHVFFSSMAVDAAGAVLAYGISHATSRDGVHWAVADGNPLLSGAAGPSVISGVAGGYSLFYYKDSAEDRAAMPSVFSPERGAWEVTAASLEGPWVPAPGAATGGRAVAWDGSVPTEALGWVATGDFAAGLHDGSRRWYYPAFSVRDPPPGFEAPTHNGVVPAVFALSVMARAPPPPAAAADALVEDTSAAVSDLSPTAASTFTTGALVFEDTFDGPLNTSKWHVQEGVHLHGVYTAANAFTSDGNLVLRTVAENQTVDGIKFHVSSGAVDTSTSLVQQYGAWEARLRMPDVNATGGFRLHASVWLVNLLPWHSANGSDCGTHQAPEVDLIEYDPLEWTHVHNGAGPWAEGHFHAFFQNCTSRWAPYKYYRGGADADFHSSFHIWRIEWLEGSLAMLVDGVELLRVTDPGWLQGLSGPLFFLLTNAIMEAALPTADDVLPQTMLVDYVRIWSV